MIVSVPASSSNLGPGFDCFGIAWKCFNTIEFSLSDKTEIIGCPVEYMGEDNLCYLGFKKALSEKGKTPLPVKITFRECEIPIARGLGSSASLIVAGIMGASELYGLGLSDEEVLHIATAMEGHPDNATPSIYGGFVAAVYDGEDVSVAPFDVSPYWSFTVFIPDYELKTAMARSVLPDSYSRKDAVQNIGCTAMLIKAMESGDGELLKAALRDRIHEPYRKKLIPEYEQVEKLVMENGADGLCISGAGSTMLCFSNAETQEKIIEAGKKAFPGWIVRGMELYTR
ncbi:MAG: homoserine kinase [Oscillospiraceae bacterium]|nr:homoserine kinase [Oscillospiraceae bacterium]